MKFFRTKLFVSLAILSGPAILNANSLETHNAPCPILCPVFPLSAENDCCHNLHLDIGLLYLQPSLPHLIVGIQTQQVLNETIDGINYTDEKITELHPCFDYSLGLTASLGYLTKHDDWYVGTRFDFLSASTTSSYNTNDELSKEIWSYFPWPGSFRYNDYDNIEWLDDYPYPRASYNGKVDLYFFDALLSRGSFHSKNFSYEPFAGVKAIWIYTTETREYFAPDGFNSSRPDAYNGFYTVKMNNWGAGPMFGFNGEYALSCCISIYSDSDIALLYGEGNWTRNTFYDNTEPGDSGEYTTISYSDLGCAFFIPFRSSLGLKFSRYFLEESHYIALKIGYDVRTILAFPDTDRGLYLNGLYTNLIWNF